MDDVEPGPPHVINGPSDRHDAWSRLSRGAPGRTGMSGRKRAPRPRPPSPRPRPPVTSSGRESLTGKGLALYRASPGSPPSPSTATPTPNHPPLFTTRASRRTENSCGSGRNRPDIPGNNARASLGVSRTGPHVPTRDRGPVDNFADRRPIGVAVRGPKSDTADHRLYLP